VHPRDNRQDHAVDSAQLDGWPARPEIGWSMGVLGAIAEFVRAADEPAQVRPGEVITDRGGIRLTARAGLTAVEHDATADPDRYGRATSLCLPLDDARRAGRRVLTVLGADTEALREQDRYTVLVDLGLGLATLDVCVRVDDPGLLDVLAASPPRVFRTPRAYRSRPGGRRSPRCISAK
jgi:hypothetical protein